MARRARRKTRRKERDGGTMNIYEFRGRKESRVDDETEDLAERVLGAAIEVQRKFGPGLPEVSYRNALSHELTLRGIPHRVEAPVPIYYKGILVAQGSVDILVADRLVIELKVAETLSPLHKAQVIAYLQALKLQLGLLLNFNVEVLRDGMMRVINTYRRA
jgi:GxxExxY protein